VSEGVPVNAFTSQLAVALRLRGPTLHLSRETLPPALALQFSGRSATADERHSLNGGLAREGRLSLWAGEQERTHSVVLMEADASASAWTRFCVRHADVVLLVARPSDEPSLSRAERTLWPLIRTSQRRDVVLLHHPDLPGRPPHAVISRVLRERPLDAAAAAEADDDDDAAVEAAAAFAGDWSAVRRLLRSRRRKLEGVLARIRERRRLLVAGGQAAVRQAGGSIVRKGSVVLRTMLPPAAAARIEQHLESGAGRATEVANDLVEHTAERLGDGAANLREAGANTSWLLHVSATKIQAMFVQRSLRRSARLAARVSTNMAEWLTLRQPTCCHNVRIGNDADISRLARLLSGSAIAVVLGGGGARGLAHVGVLRALTEAGVPIDMIGGTSQGAFVGALWAMSLDVGEVTRRAREWSSEMSKKWKLAYDITFPFTSWLSGAGFNWELGKVLGGFSVTHAPSRADVSIESLWVPYFCVSANLVSVTLYYNIYYICYR